MFQNDVKYLKWHFNIVEISKKIFADPNFPTSILRSYVQVPKLKGGNTLFLRLGSLDLTSKIFNKNLTTLDAYSSSL